MCHCPIAQCRSTERCFHRVAVRDAQHPYNNATGAFFIALNFEFTTLERKLLLRRRRRTGSKLKLTRWRISDKRCDALRANEHKMKIKRRERRFQNHSNHILADIDDYRWCGNDAHTLSATFLCSIRGNTCSDNFLSGTRLFSQP